MARFEVYYTSEQYYLVVVEAADDDAARRAADDLINSHNLHDFYSSSSSVEFSDAIQVDALLPSKTEGKGEP